MALTRTFRDTVKARADSDPEFRAALLKEAVDLMLAGDLATGKAVLRDYINATIGFTELAAEVGKPSKSLMRMFSKEGNPRHNNLTAVFGQLQAQEGVRIGITLRRNPKPTRKSA